MTANKIKTVAGRVGNGILAAGTVLHNASLQNEINEIDTEADALRAQLSRLEERRTDLVDRKI